MRMPSFLGGLGLFRFTQYRWRAALDCPPDRDSCDRGEERLVWTILRIRRPSARQVSAESGHHRDGDRSASSAFKRAYHRHRQVCWLAELEKWAARLVVACLADCERESAHEYEAHGPSRFQIEPAPR
jgi:hypothetical protein